MGKQKNRRPGKEFEQQDIFQQQQTMRQVFPNIAVGVQEGHYKALCISGTKKYVEGTFSKGHDHQRGHKDHAYQNQGLEHRALNKSLASGVEQGQDSGEDAENTGWPLTPLLTALSAMGLEVIGETVSQPAGRTSRCTPIRNSPCETRRRNHPKPGTRHRKSQTHRIEQSRRVLPNRLMMLARTTVNYVNPHPCGEPTGCAAGNLVSSLGSCPGIIPSRT